MIQIKDVTKLYPAKEAGNGSGKDNGAGSIHALDHISLHVTHGGVAVDHGAVGVGEIDAGESDWLSRPAVVGRDLARRARMSRASQPRI